MRSELRRGGGSFLRQRVEVFLDRRVISGRHLLPGNGLTEALLYLPHGFLVIFGTVTSRPHLLGLPLQESLARGELGRAALLFEVSLGFVVLGCFATRSLPRVWTHAGAEADLIIQQL